MQNHGVNLAATNLYAQPLEYHHVKFHVLRHLRDAGILKQRTHSLGKGGGVLGRKAHIPCLVRLHGKRHAHYAVAEHVKPCGLGVKANLLVG